MDKKEGSTRQEEVKGKEKKKKKERKKERRRRERRRRERRRKSKVPVNVCASAWLKAIPTKRYSLGQSGP